MTLEHAQYIKKELDMLKSPVLNQPHTCEELDEFERDCKIYDKKYMSILKLAYRLK